MPTEGLQHRLVAILSADVQGYSRLMGDDEAATVLTLTAYRTVMQQVIEGFSGRVVDMPGDNLLAEFGSAVDAVQCAVEIQDRLHARNAELPEHRRMVFRIGINLGDVAVAGDEIYGDGVNIAARIEALAAPGGVSISGTVYDQVENKLPLAIAFQGDHEVKNITKRVPVYEVATDATSIGDAGRPPLEPPDRPSIAVLPFVNMSGDPEQEYFSDGLTEDLITDLSRVSGILVIARNSVFTYKGRAVKVDEVGRDLAVRTVLEGSVRKAGNRVRITAQLVDAATGGHVWAERYDRDLSDIFAVQDEVTGKIVAALSVHLSEDEREFVAHRGTESLEAYDYVLRGKELVARTTEQTNVEAKEMFRKAIEIDGAYAEAHARLGMVYLTDYSLGFAGPESLDRALELAQQSLRLDRSVPEPRYLAALVHLLRGRHEQALQELEETGGRDANSAEACSIWADVLCYVGRAEEAIALAQKAMRLDPHYPFYYPFLLGHACYLTGDLPAARAALTSALRRNPDFHVAHLYLAAVAGELGRIDEARDHVDALLERRPDFSLDELRSVYRDPAVVARVGEALAAAGLDA